MFLGNQWTHKIWVPKSNWSPNFGRILSNFYVHPLAVAGSLERNSIPTAQELTTPCQKKLRRSAARNRCASGQHLYFTAYLPMARPPRSQTVHGVLGHLITGHQDEAVPFTPGDRTTIQWVRIRHRRQCTRNAIDGALLVGQGGCQQPHGAAVDFTSVVDRASSRYDELHGLSRRCVALCWYDAHHKRNRAAWDAAGVLYSTSGAKGSVGPAEVLCWSFASNMCSVAILWDAQAGTF